MKITINDDGSGMMDGWEFSLMGADARRTLANDGTDNPLPGMYEIDDDDEALRFSVTAGRLNYD